MTLYTFLWNMMHDYGICRILWNKNSILHSQPLIETHHVSSSCYTAEEWAQVSSVSDLQFIAADWSSMKLLHDIPNNVMSFQEII